MPDKKHRNILVIGYGNPGRLDDGLGPAFADAIQELGIPGVTVESDYQLTVEDAALLARHDMVVFVDASVSGAEPFAWTPAGDKDESSFSTHSVQPGSLVALARTLFNSRPEAYVLAIRGYEFNDFGERLSPKARANLENAVSFFQTRIAGGETKAAATTSTVCNPSWN